MIAVTLFDLTGAVKSTTVASAPSTVKVTPVGLDW